MTSPSDENADGATAKERLERELNNFLSEVLAAKPGEVDKFATAIRSKLTADQIDVQAKLPDTVLEQIDRIERALAKVGKDLSGQPGGTSSGSAIRNKLADRDGGEESGGGLEGPRVAQVAHVHYHIVQPWPLIWLPVALVAAIAALTIVSAFLLRPAVDAQVSNAAGQNAQPGPAVESQTPAIERGWRRLLGQIGDGNGSIAPPNAQLLCDAPAGQPASVANCRHFAIAAASFDAQRWNQIVAVITDRNIENDACRTAPPGSGASQFVRTCLAQMGAAS